MWRNLLLSILLAACATGTLAQSGAKADGSGAVPGKSVIYLVRSSPDSYQRGADVYLDDGKRVTMYPGTHVRWVVSPGLHHIQGAAPDTGAVRLRTAAGKVYFIRQDVGGITAPMSTLQLMNERDGRAALKRSSAVGAR